MKISWGIYFALLAAPLLPAGTIVDVSSNTSTVIGSGDTLVFQVLSGNFAGTALSFGQSIYPSTVSFSLMTAPISGAGTFEASLQSSDGSVSVALDNPIGFTGGMLFKSGYSGAVSTLNGYLTLSPLLSEALFSSPPVLVLTYTGPDFVLGLDPYTLRQELQVSLGSGPLTAGALQGAVTLETPDPPHLQMALLTLGQFGADVSDSAPGSAVPEPDSALLSLGGGALLIGISRIARGRQLRQDRIAQEKSTVCNS